ncbi:MAG: MlaD family protein [Planctomycetes bacterium]|nr:MlaD family protein [Planctomycetota bacterium]
MSRSKFRSDLITGAFALAVVASFIAVVAYLQTFGPSTEGVQYSIMFEDVGGLSGSAPVIVAGQRVGKVVGIDTVPVISAQGARQVEVEVKIVILEEYKDTVVIPTDSVARVQMGSFFGGNQLVLNLGESTELVRAGQRFPRKGEPPVEIGDIVESANDTMKELQAGIKNISDMLKKPELSKNIEDSLTFMRSALEKLDKGLTEMEPAFSKVGPTFDSAQALIDELKLLVERNGAAIDNTLASLESASGKLDKLLGENGDGVPVLVKNLTSIADNLDALVSNINDMVLDNQLNIAISLENVRETTDSLRHFARRIESDPSLLIWGGEEENVPGLDRDRAVPNVDEMEIRNSGRRPRKESD